MQNKVAVIGCGHWGKNLVRNFSELDALGAVCDPDPDIATRMAEQYKVAAAGFEAICEDDEISGLVIAAPAPLHAPLSLQALAARKHIFVEKPLAMNCRESESMIVAAASANRHLMVGHLLQYHPAYVKLKEMTDNGDLGAVSHIQSNRLSFGKIRNAEDVVWSFAPHDISMVLGLAGGEPNDVQIEKFDLTGNGLADKASLTLQFDNRVSAQINVSWLNPDKEQKLTVIGSKGMAVFDDTQPWNTKLQIFPQYGVMKGDEVSLEKGEAYYVSLPEAEPLKIECQYFLDLISGTVSPRTDGAEGNKVLKVLSSADH